MPYAILDDIKNSIPDILIAQLTDDANGAVIDNSIVTEKIARADSYIDTLIGTQYPVPLTAPVPDIIKSISVRIAIYHLYERRDTDIPEARLTAYNAARKDLKDIRDGKTSLPIDTAATGSFSSAVLVTTHFDDTPGVSGLEV